MTFSIVRVANGFVVKCVTRTLAPEDKRQFGASRIKTVPIIPQTHVAKETTDVLDIVSRYLDKMQPLDLGEVFESDV